MAALAIAAALAQINPIWLYGPYSPVTASALSQPDWYIAFMEGSLRLMPGVDTVVAGHTIAWNVFIPAAVLPAVFFMLAGAYPFVEQFVTGDRRYHQVLDRPRNEPSRTAIGAAVVAMAAVLQLAGADDVIAEHLNIPIYGLVWTLRIGFFVAPAVTFWLARKACLALQRRDRRVLATGISQGVVTTRPHGGYQEEVRPLNEEEQAQLPTRRPAELTASIPRHIVPLPTPGRVRAQLLSRANRFYTSYRVEVPSSYGQPDGQQPLSEDGASADGESSPADQGG